jgi:arylsulfatase A-like enzyme
MPADFPAAWVWRRLMDRRKFLSVTSAGLAAANVGETAPGDAKPNESYETSSRFVEEKTGKNPFRVSRKGGTRPNIFLITMDMVSPDFYQPWRPLSLELQLPTLHGLMKDSVFFRNAFCTVPLCAPSRASYLTGRYTYVLGNGERAPDGLETELRPDDVIFPEYLKAFGYLTKHCGKCHVGTKKFIDAFGENDNPWNRWSPPIYDDEAYLDYQRRLGVKPQKYSKEIILLQRDRKTPGNSVGGWIVQADGKPFPLEAQYSYYSVCRAIHKLEDALTSPSTRGQPVYLQLDIFDPHQPLSVPEGFDEREKELRAVIRLPETYKKVQAHDWNAFPNQPRIYDLYRQYWGLYHPQSLLDYRVGYALQMEVVDRSLALLFRTLKEKDLYDDALIIVMSDHGEMNGRWGIIDKGVYLYPDVVRTPLLVKMPGRMDIKPRTVDAPVSLLDVAPTVLSVVGIEPEARMDGQSLLPYLQRAAPQGDRDLIFSCGWHVGVNFACGIQRWDGHGSHHLYSYNASSNVDELYDLNAVEAENLSQEPGYASLRKEMINRLGTLLRDDPRWGGYWSPYRVDEFFALPRTSGGMQLLPR